MQGENVADKISIISIMRAGNCMADAFSGALPHRGPRPLRVPEPQHPSGGEEGRALPQRAVLRSHAPATATAYGSRRGHPLGARAARGSVPRQGDSVHRGVLCVQDSRDSLSATTSAKRPCPPPPSPRGPSHTWALGVFPALAALEDDTGRDALSPRLPCDAQTRSCPTICPLRRKQRHTRIAAQLCPFPDSWPCAGAACRNRVPSPLGIASERVVSSRRPSSFQQV